MKKAGWPKQKEVHSPENRIGQAWKEKTVQVIGKCGESYKLFDAPDGHFTCNCGAVVRYDDHGNAACENCGEIYNSGKVVIVKRKSRITTRSFIYKAFNKVD
jgi:hypothetical protein